MGVVEKNEASTNTKNPRSLGYDAAPVGVPTASAQGHIPVMPAPYPSNSPDPPPPMMAGMTEDALVSLCLARGGEETDEDKNEEPDDRENEVCWSEHRSSFI